MALRSRCPTFSNLTQEQFRYLEGLDRRLPLIADLPASPTNEEIATAFNALMSSLKDARIMMRE